MSTRVTTSTYNDRLSRQKSLRLRPIGHAVALMLTAGVAMHAHAGVNLANVGAQISAARSAAAGGGVNLGVGVSPQQAFQASQPSIQNLAHAAQGIAQQIAAQQAAAVAGLNTASTVPNGLAVGGLQVAQGITFAKDNNGDLVSQNTDPGNSLLWVNAYGPQQTSAANGHVTVNVTQTAQSAVATWQTMNVGSNTTLNFDQSAGTQTNGANDWVILNRIMDPSGRPSQIFGNVTAQGTVLVINRNGILFGAGSQVNVHSLIASSLDFLNTNDDHPQASNVPVIGNLAQDAAGTAASNQLFLSSGLAQLEAGQSGIGGGTAGQPNEILGFGNSVTISTASQYQAPGDIVISPGASITTHTNGTGSDGGLVLLAATNVTNAGSITATDGQVILAAGVGVSLLPNASNPQILLPELTGRITVDGGANPVDITPVGTLTNTGLVQTVRGTIDLLGTNVNQNGVVGTTTSVTTPGGILISTVDENIANTPTDTVYPGTGTSVVTPTNGGNETNRAGTLIFGNGSVTSITPDSNGQTDTSAPGTTFTPGTIAMTAGSVWFQSGSLVEAPGATVSVTALSPTSALDVTPPGDTSVPGRIYLDTGATIDVSGLANVQLPISDILLTVPLLTANELADSPLLRDGFLNGLKNVIVDSTLSGTNSNGQQWVGSPVLNLAGDVSLMPRTVDQLLTNGGTITLSGAQVMTADGSSLNLNGGYVHYLGGVVSTTRLIDANGAIVPIGQASPFDTYVGIAGEFIDSHPRWGVTNDWFDPLLSGGAYESDFIVGGNAGTLNVYASQAMVLDGNVSAQVVGGNKQVQDNDLPTGGSFSLGAQGAAATLGANPGPIGEPGTVILQDSAPELSDVAAGFGANTPLDTAALGALPVSDPNNLLATIVVPVNTLNEGGFANVSVTDFNGSIVVAAGTTLTVQPGGSIKLSTTGNNARNAQPTIILGSLIAPSGTISIANAGDIDVGPSALLSVAGLWVNNDAQAAPGTTAGDSEFINGGTVSLSTTQTNSGGATASGTDTTGSILLQSGSEIDASSGGEMQSNGQMLMQNGVVEGTAGSVSLLTYTGPGFGSDVTAPRLPSSQPTAGRIQMDGTIDSFGFAGGGTLTLQALGFQIGGDPSQAPGWDLVLPANFFAQQGFGKYVLNAMYDATIAPGATVALTQQNLIPDTPALLHTVSGSSLAEGGLTSPGTLDPFHRQSTSLVMTAGNYLSWSTVSNAPPEYAGVTGAATLGQGASLIADAGASISLGSPAQVTVLGSIVAPGGTITLSADSAPGSPDILSGQSFRAGGYTSVGKSVWLGSDAVLDVSGTVLIDPLATPVKNGSQTIIPISGKVLPGGSVVILDDSGAVAAQAGAVINVSGMAGTFDELQPTGGYAPQPVWSDAGSITLGASSGLYFDATLQAQPGAALAQGGTLILVAEQNAVTAAPQPGAGTPVSSPAAQVLILQQSGDLLPAGQMPGEAFPGVFSTTLPNGTPIEQTSSGVLQFSADRLNGSGIANLVLDGTQNAVNPPVPIAFEGNVALNLPGSVTINSNQIVALGSNQVDRLLPTLDSLSGMWQPAQDTISSLVNDEATVGQPVSIGSTVSINAPYVAIVGPTTVLQPFEAAADSTLNVNAEFIDLENQFQLNNFGQANFVSSGDIRLSSTNAARTRGAPPNSLMPGELFTPGNLTFQAADVYPSTGSPFILDAVGPTDAATSVQAPTTITFLSNGSTGVPLSAGGALLVDATDIVQAGTVRAPSGSLIFGVGDTGDAATQAQFNSLPLVATDSVSLANGSVTSVSLDGAIVPFGTTVDGVEWQFNPIANLGAAPDVTAPPSKFVSVNGTSVSLNPGATIDLSGGGDLQAQEWVPGTGGSRDLLSQYNVSFATTSSGVVVPTNIGAANVYAVMPGAQSPVAAYDPIFAQTTQPVTNANGTVSSTTVSTGIGQAALNGAVGQSVYLSGVPGLPAGYYTLLPAKYATLPGAYRVTVSSIGGSVAPGASQTLPDGTVAVAGYMGNALTGSRSATPVLFDVQSGAVWQQYSQYTLTSANSFFPPLAANAGNITPPLPMDAGQLVIAATRGLTLGATLNTAAAPGGAPAEVDIASQNIQIVGSGEAALPGYLQISADQLDALDAGSLLIGGIRTQTTSGITIAPIANSVVVSNDAADPLTGPEVMLVSAGGMQVDPGSVIAAKGAYPSARDVSISIGQNADSTTNTPAISGDGAFLSVTNGRDSVVTRQDTSGTGVLTVGAGATLDGGAALTLDSSGNLTFDPAATLSGNTIAVDGSAITFTGQTGAAAASLPGFVVGPAQIAQLANAQEVILRSSGAMSFDGNVDATFGQDVDLSAGSFSSNGGAVTINAQDVAFTNELGAVVPASTTGGGTLTVNAGEIDFGTGDKSLSGLSAATFNATAGIVGQGIGRADFGAAAVTLNTPIYLADTGSATTIQTTGTLTLNSTPGTALAIAPVGGAVDLIGGTLNDNGAMLEAPAGNVSLEATTGDLTIAAGSLVSSVGVAKQFFDETVYAPGGTITLTADTGSVNVATGSTLDFSGAAGGGAAGNLTLSAPDRTVQLAGTIKGNAASGFTGGSFSMNTGGTVDLDNLSTVLALSGVNDVIAVQTDAGNLSLSAGNTLKASTVSLTANGGSGGQDPNNGNVQIFGTVDASGAAGGQIGLYGKSGVDVEGSLLAAASDPSQRGGTVAIDTTGTPGPTVTLNSSYGYENISSANSGVITVGANAKIDVSGGTAGSMLAGKVSFRAPLLDSGDVNVSIAPTAQISGARSVDLEAYAVWSTTDPVGTGGLAQHFDGIIDPAGWYDSSGNLVAGTFTTQSGQTISYTPGSLTADALTADLTNDFFTATTADAAHQTFYGYLNGDTTTATPGTLMGFIENGLGTMPVFASRFANIANFQAVPGVELDNPSTANNSGNISVLSNWNLGAGQPNSSGSITPAFRYQNTIAPMLTFRAVGNVDVDASITDGFYQNQVATILGGTAPGGGGSTETFTDAQTLFNNLMGTDSTVPTIVFNGGTSGLLTALVGPNNQPLDPNAVLSAPLTGQSSAYYTDYLAYANAWATDYSAWMGTSAGAPAINGHVLAVSAAPSPTAPVITAFGSYDAYLTAYVSWINTSLTRVNAGTFGTPPPITFSTDTSEYLNYITAYFNPAIGSLSYLGKMLNPSSSTILPGAIPKSSFNFFYNPQAPLSIPSTGITTIGDLPGNSPSNVPTANNPLPLDFATLLGGQSSSYRIVAGADMASANPLSLQAVSVFQAQSATLTAGNITLNGHTSYIDSNELALLDPTMIRTGSGSIDIAAGYDVLLSDPVAPGVIYTAGVPADGSPTNGKVSIVNGGTVFANPDILVTPAVNPEGGGNITIHAQNDIIGVENAIDSDGTVTGVQGANISQFWWQWMEVGNPTGQVGQTTPTTQFIQTSIDFGAFDQGVMSVGGNVSISAGGNITDLAVSLPTTWYLTNTNTDNPTVNTVGGGNLLVNAGGNILSGDYFVARGTATIGAGGQIASDGQVYANLQGRSNQFASDVSTLLATQDGVLDVTARQGANIGAVVDPSYVEDGNLVNFYHQTADEQGYSSTSAVNVTVVTGNVDFGTLSSPVLIGGAGGGSVGAGTIVATDNSTVLPATVNLVALSGGITAASGGALSPSATGNLSLIADQSIVLSDQQNGFSAFGMLDLNPASMPSPADPGNVVPSLTNDNASAHAQAALHGDDTVQAQIYSLTGNIVDGILEPVGAASNPGFYDHLVNIVLDKAATIEAGQDIVNLAFQGQNLRDSDVTRIVAGRDIEDTPLAPAQQPNTLSIPSIPSIQLGGPGTLDVEAGRDIGPLTSQAEAFAVLGSGYPIGTGLNTGIDAVGNANNPNLPHDSANVQVLFGVGPGIDDANFIAAYINPVGGVAGVPSAMPALITFMERYDAGQVVDTGLVTQTPAIQPLTAAQAWTQFQALPGYEQQLFVEQVFFGVLNDVGNDFNNPSSPFFQQYTRGYQAINTLFPASFGYTANNLSGGTNGANSLVDTGNLDIRSTTIQTQQGGTISILGPGGQALVGSSSAPPAVVNGAGQVVAGPGTQGILTLEQGDINIFTDQSLLLAQSRVFTEQGGNMTIWSSNGDINAGKGSTSAADIPPPEYVCDANHYCTFDAKGEVTGAGIATLQTIPGAPPGNINLLAPRGTVDAGAAGIRVSGNLNVAALHVLNAANIQVQGTKTGVPIVAAVDTGALTAASSAASAVTQMAQNLVRNNASGVQQRHWIISVQVEGFGDANDSDDDTRKKPKPGQLGYNASSEVLVLGFGKTGDSQRAHLTAEEQKKLGGI
jgi:filamentous hemagglutinin family protein